MLEKLKQSDVDKAKPRSKVYRIADGGGLALQVMPKREGSGRYFIYRYRYMNLQRMMIIDSARYASMRGRTKMPWGQSLAAVREGMADRTLNRRAS